MTDTPARDALMTGVPEYVTTHVAYGDFTKLEAMTEAVRVLLDGTVPPEQVLAALVEAHGLDEVLRALGGEVVGFTWSSTQGVQWGGPEGTGHRTERPAWRFPTKETTDG